MSKSESKIWGEDAKAIKEYLSARSVGLHLRKEKAYLWDKFTSRCKENKIKINPDGGEHMLETYLLLQDVFFPIAKTLKVDPQQYMSEQIQAIIDTINDVDNKRKIIDFRRIHEKVVVDTKNTIVGKIKSVVSH